MEFNINADIYLRLAGASLQPEEKHAIYGDALRAVRVEYRDGVAVAIATNGKILVAECLDECGENGEVSLIVDAKMIELATAERDASGKIIVTQAPGWTVARGIETGKMYPLNAEVPGAWPDWRGLVPTSLPSKNTGSFHIIPEQMARIAETCPSGCVVLPKFADKDAPIVLRDKSDDNWMALVFIEDSGRTDFPKHAEIPDWVR